MTFIDNPPLKAAFKFAALFVGISTTVGLCTRYKKLQKIENLTVEPFSYETKQDSIHIILNGCKTTYLRQETGKYKLFEVHGCGISPK